MASEGVFVGHLFQLSSGSLFFLTYFPMTPFLISLSLPRLAVLMKKMMEASLHDTHTMEKRGMKGYFLLKDFL